MATKNKITAFFSQKGNLQKFVVSEDDRPNGDYQSLSRGSEGFAYSSRDKLIKDHSDKITIEQAFNKIAYLLESSKLEIIEVVEYGRESTYRGPSIELGVTHIKTLLKTQLDNYKNNNSMVASQVSAHQETTPVNTPLANGFGFSSN